MGETYFRYDVPTGGLRLEDAVGDMGRVGSTSLFIYSGITLAGAFVLPLLVRSLDDESFTRRPPQAMARLAETWSDRKPDLVTTWMCGHLLFAAAMSLAPLAASYRFATVLVCLCGLPWTIATWAPPALLSVEVNRISRAAETGAYRRLDGEPDVELSMLGPGDAPMSPTSRQGRPGADKSPTAKLSGVCFGVLIVSTTLPQFIGTFIASVVFAVLEPGKSPELAADGGRGSGAKGPNTIAMSVHRGHERAGGGVCDAQAAQHVSDGKAAAFAGGSNNNTWRRVEFGVAKHRHGVQKKHHGIRNLAGCRIQKTRIPLKAMCSGEKRRPPVCAQLRQTALSRSPPETFHSSSVLALDRAPSGAGLGARASTSVSLPASRSASGAGGAAAGCWAASSAANQLTDHQRAALRADSTATWTLAVASSSAASSACSAAKDALAARSRLGVGPGVKMDARRSCRKDAMEVAGADRPARRREETAHTCDQPPLPRCTAQGDKRRTRRVQWRRRRPTSEPKESRENVKRAEPRRAERRRRRRRVTG